MKTSVDKVAFGRDIEESALEYLKTQGCRFKARNFYCRFGEIDLIVVDKRTLVFVEVRFRAKSGLASGLESVTPSKQRRIIKSAQHYLAKNALGDRMFCRFDVVSVSQTAGSYCFDWVKDAFQTH